MKFLEQFKNVDWQDLGRWPFVVRASAVGAWLIAAVLVLGYLFVVNGQWPQLDQERKRQDDLWSGILRSAEQGGELRRVQGSA